MKEKLYYWLVGIRLKLIKLLAGKSTMLLNCTFPDDVRVYVNDPAFVIGVTFRGQVKVEWIPDSEYEDGEQ